jgi:hypothetical protein
VSSQGVRLTTLLRRVNRSTGVNLCRRVYLLKEGWVCTRLPGLAVSQGGEEDPGDYADQVPSLWRSGSQVQ